jgi:flagellar hook-associated protein 3 FlgL
MRVTQSMLTNNLLRNLNTNYGEMAKLQEQIQSGSVLTRPSDDPVVAVKGMQNRIQVDRVEQYQRNIGDAYSWLDASDNSLSQVGEALQRVKELVVQAANDTNTQDDREKVNAEIAQIKLQIRDIANTQVGENYIFTGTHTDQPMYINAELEQNKALSETGKANSFKINVFDGVSLQINTPASDLFKKVDDFMLELEKLLNSDKTSSEIGAALGVEINKNGVDAIPALDSVTNLVLSLQADVGARQNRIEMMDNRLSIVYTNAVKQLSENEDTDYSKAITEMTTAESIHQASLSVGSKIIRQTLVDFL